MKYCFLLLTVVYTLTACTKTDIVAPPAESTSRMLEYKVVNLSGDPIYGVINEEQKTVKVYLPYHYFMNLLQPEIRVSTGATVSPASGELVDSVLFEVYNPGQTKYKVTGKGGAVTEYTLQVEVMQPELKVNELTTDPDAPFEMKSSAEVGVWGFGKITGTNFLQLNSPKITPEVIFVSAAGAEIPMHGYSSVNNSGYNQNEFNFLMPLAANITPGLYTVKVRNYARQVTLKNKVKIVAP